MYGMISAIPIRRLVRKTVLEMMTKLYGPEAKMIDPEQPGTEQDWAARAGLSYLRLTQAARRRWEKLRRP